jgi:hypothetical protein
MFVEQSRSVELPVGTCLFRVVSIKDRLGASSADGMTTHASRE